MSGVSNPPLSDTQKLEVKQFSINLAQNAATYDLFTASGDVSILSVDLYVSVAGTGLTSVSVQTNDTTPVVVLASGSGLVAALTIGKNLLNLASQFFLASGKKVQYTIVGTGSAGTIKAVVRYMRATAGADIA